MIILKKGKECNSDKDATVIENMLLEMYVDKILLYGNERLFY